MIDEAGLRALVAVMITYDRVGKAVWSRVLGIAAERTRAPGRQLSSMNPPSVS